MSAAEKLAQHLANRPQSPGDVGANHPRTIKYHKDLTAWVSERETLEMMVRVDATIPSRQDSFGSFNSTPRKTEYVRPPRTTDPDYMAEKKRQQRARDKAAPRACMDCGGVRHGRKARCAPCDELAAERQAVKKNGRRSLIREGLNQRKLEAA